MSFAGPTGKRYAIACVATSSTTLRTTPTISIRRLGHEHDLTMLMATHQMGFAKEFADRVRFFSQGKIIEQAPPQQFFGAPQHERTQQFLLAVREAT